jgi:hypothetical protein
MSAPESQSFRIVTDRVPTYDHVARAFGFDPDSGAPMTAEETEQYRKEMWTDGSDH